MDDLENLIRKAQKGDKQAFEKIYNLFNKRIYRYCDYNIKTKEVAQDITQETFIKCWKSLPSFSFKEGGYFQAFLFRIARNLIIDESRKRKTVQIEDDLEGEAEDLEGLIDQKDEEKKVKEALLRLNDNDRQIIILRYFEDLSFTEVEKVTGIKSGALRVRTHRILQKLKEDLK